MLMMVWVYPYYILAPVVIFHHPTPSPLLIYFMFLKSKKIYVQSKFFCQDNHVFFEFHYTFIVMKDKSTCITLLAGPSYNVLYSIRLPQFQQVPKVSFTSFHAFSNIWYQRVGHPYPQLMQTMLSKYSLPIFNKISSSFCNSCHIEKSSKLHFSSFNFKSTCILDLLFCDLWGTDTHYFI